MLLLQVLLTKFRVASGCWFVACNREHAPTVQNSTDKKQLSMVECRRSKDRRFRRRPAVRPMTSSELVTLEHLFHSRVSSTWLFSTNLLRQQHAHCTDCARKHENGIQRRFFPFFFFSFGMLYQSNLECQLAQVVEGRFLCIFLRYFHSLLWIQFARSYLGY